MTPIHRIASVLKARIAPVIIKLCTKWRGLDCEVFFPLDAGSVYGQADTQYRYGNVPDFSGLVFITGLKGERRPGDQTLDNMQDAPPEAWCTSEEPWPLFTLVKASVGGEGIFTLRVSLILGTEAIDGLIYQHYQLTPVEARP